MLRSLLLLLGVFTLSHASAHFFPSENAKLNYRIIGFMLPEKELSKDARIEIARGLIHDEADFKKNIVVTRPCNGPRNIIEVPWFNTDYTWRVSSKGKNGTLHYFATLTSATIDTQKQRVTILSKSSKYKDGYFFLDRTHALYNMNGEPVWYMPSGALGFNDYLVVRDVRPTLNHTITMVTGDKVFEVDWSGVIQWQAPKSTAISGDSIEHYHHEVIKLRNGHYMLMSNQVVNLAKEMDHLTDSLKLAGILPVKPGDDTGRRPNILERFSRNMFGTLIEFDDRGKVIWSWKTYPYFRDNYLVKNPVLRNPVDLHENSFAFDQTNKFVYLSLKNLGQILKIEYPSGKVIAVYGRKEYRNVMHDSTAATFCDQHSIKLAKDGDLYMFNNNICNRDGMPNVLKLKEPTLPDDSLRVVWQFDCPVTMPPNRKLKKLLTTSGGNVQELEGGDVFISMCTPYADLFLVNRDKNILWRALPQLYNEAKKIWEPANTYRATFVSRAELEALIWKNTPGELP